MHSKVFEIVIFIYLVSVFCIPSSLGIYKRSTTTVETLNLADWSVDLDQTGVTGSVQIIEGDTNGGTYTLNVVSDSEVDVIYDIIVSNIPTGVQVKLDTGAYAPENSSVTFSNAGIILYGDGPNTHTLTFKANTGATLVSNRTINIDVNFRQN